ncbi:Hypothetical protein MELLADRAFT_38921 [Melampsora larici-populina 98AG31]|uniref:Copper acquisition factor BIM1-like domain-containing protein n=1 Tax=Melampsora larici-populina (strain 98AG31 / pathotype 3-4-7) TaxID=747676 RepID=F4S0G9_MELLP|nr:Hypothetical protein MELLADRAFT_38921 [Melampsora larici-populina 98AG31]EGG01765.1 Hypothetical protein MELLADRAFT_38921 [Melampsora larici-populina 98AG31]
MFSKALTSILMALFAAHLISAHFTLDFPATRGFDEDKEASFCGGFSVPTNSSGRTKFPLSGLAPVRITSHHQKAEVTILLSVKPNPTSLSDFKTKGQSNCLMSYTTIVGQGKFCFMVDVSNLASKITPAPVEGSLATIQVLFNGGDGILYQCTDVVLTQAAKIPKKELCSTF